VSLFSKPLAVAVREPSRTSIDEWVSREHNRGVNFEPTGTFDREQGKGRIECRLTCYHNSNFVSARGWGDLSGDAFLEAIATIERTIGEWRVGDSR